MLMVSSGVRGFPCASAGKESTCNAGDLGSIPGLGRSPGEGERVPTLVSGPENSVDYTVHGVARSQTQLSSFQFQFSLGLVLIPQMDDLVYWIIIPISNRCLHTMCC